MSTTTNPIQIPTPDRIREQLAAAVAEARALRQLLRLAEAAHRAQEARIRGRQPVRKEGRGRAFDR